MISALVNWLKTQAEISQNFAEFGDDFRGTENDRIINDMLVSATQKLKSKTIEINGAPYLQRFFVRQDVDTGVQHWLHRFLTADSERHLHTHPWKAESILLSGWYIEERGNNIQQHYRRGDKNVIAESTLHRIVTVKPNTWTYLQVQPGREATWHFIEQDGTRVEQASSPEAWWV